MTIRKTSLHIWLIYIKCITIKYLNKRTAHVVSLIWKVFTWCIPGLPEAQAQDNTYHFDPSQQHCLKNKNCTWFTQLSVVIRLNPTKTGFPSFDSL